MLDISGLRAVERLQRPSVESFERFLVPEKRAVVLESAVMDWKALTRWTPDYLRQRVGTIRAQVAVSHDGVFTGDPVRGFEGTREEMTIADYIDRITAPRPGDDRHYYLQQRPIDQSLSALRSDLEPLKYVRDLPVFMHLWFGPGGSVSSLHHDLADNLLVQIKGRKQVVLFPAAERDNLYPFPKGCAIDHMSQVNIESPDLARFPRFRIAAAMVAEIGPGDVLHIPAAWWHQVYSLDLSISVNFWYGPPRTA